MNERPLSEAVEKTLARVTNSVAVPNVWAATFAEALKWHVGLMQDRAERMRKSPGRGDDK